MKAVQEIGSVTAALYSVRSNIDDHHIRWFHTVEKICSDIGVEPSLPHRCGHQIHYVNVPANTPSTYYCHSFSIPLESRFCTHQQIVLDLSLIPSIMEALSMEECNVKISPLAKMYEEDLPSQDYLEGELYCWWMKQELNQHGQASLLRTLTHTLRHVSIFPNIQALLSILCTLPFTSCSAELSFSAVKRIKTNI